MASTINATTSSGIVATADNTGSLALQTSGTTAVTINTSQNVGIGTTSPSQRLHVKSNNGQILAEATGASENPSLKLTAASNNRNWELFSWTGNAGQFGIYDGVAGQNRLLIDTSGNTMIGTSAPSGLLTVAGSYAQAGTVGLTNYTIDTTPTATVVANGASVDFTLLSGMLVVNSWGTGGVTIWLMGGGGTSAVSSIIGTVGTMSYVYPYYRWTNNSGSAQTFGFFCVRTRTGP